MNEIPENRENLRWCTDAHTNTQTRTQKWIWDNKKVQLKIWNWHEIQVSKEKMILLKCSKSSKDCMTMISYMRKKQTKQTASYWLYTHGYGTLPVLCHGSEVCPWTGLVTVGTEREVCCTVASEGQLDGTCLGYGGTDGSWLLMLTCWAACMCTETVGSLLVRLRVSGRTAMTAADAWE